MADRDLFDAIGFLRREGDALMRRFVRSHRAAAWAELRFEAVSHRSGAAINGEPAVVFNVYEQYGANTLDVTKGVDGALAELRPSLERAGIELHADLFRPANFITTATGNVRSSLLLGGALVVVVLFLFMFDLRTAAISCAAIPLSLLAAVIVLGRFGVTLNTMTLGGLAISIGVVVDDAVVGVENIVRRLRENRALARPRPMARVVLDACLEVRGAVVYATFAVVLVVLPVLALSGLAGRFFAPLGVAYVLAVLASLGVALTVIPALSMLPPAKTRPSCPTTGPSGVACGSGPSAQRWCSPR